MKKIIIISMFAVLLINSSCNNHSSGTTSTESYQEQKMSLEDQEKQNPEAFLTASGTFHPTLFGHNMKINGTITNNATVATYKDVTIKVRYISKTDSDISSENYTVYDFFPPNQTKTFEMKIEVPSGTEKLGWDVVSAVPKQ
jgi:hypothetical protein